MRLSVALWPPRDVLDLLSELPRPQISGVHWSVPGQWMIKVRPLGHVPHRTVAPLIDVLRAELEGAPAVDCVVGEATYRIGGQWLGVPVRGLEDLGSVVFEATEPLVPVTHPRPFQADIVLARGKVPRELAGQPISASWTARSVSLVADRSSPHGSRFEDLVEIPLGT